MLNVALISSALLRGRPVLNVQPNDGNLIGEQEKKIEKLHLPYFYVSNGYFRIKDAMWFRRKQYVSVFVKNQ